VWPRLLAHPLQCQASRKDGEKAGRQGELSDTVGHADQSEPEKLVQPDRFAMATAQVDDETPGRGTERTADHHTARSGPQEVDAPPPSQAEPGLVQTEQPRNPASRTGTLRRR
jgi:hypothetical protein